jgi:hypothetical protein
MKWDHSGPLFPYYSMGLLRHSQPWSNRPTFESKVFVGYEYKQEQQLLMKINGLASSYFGCLLTHI